MCYITLDNNITIQLDMLKCLNLVPCGSTDFLYRVQQKQVYSCLCEK